MASKKYKRTTSGSCSPHNPNAIAGTGPAVKHHRGTKYAAGRPTNSSGTPLYPT